VRLLAQELEDLLDVGDVLSRFLQVALEAGRELLVVDLLDQLRKGLAGELALDVEDVAQLVEEQLPRARDVRHW
jgi:hypothetical protein